MVRPASFGSLLIKPGGRSFLISRDLFVDDMEIVKQPFARRRDWLTRQVCPDDGAIGLRNDHGVVIKPFREAAALIRTG